MENELKKLAAAMRDMSDMVGDHHWQAAKAIEQLAQRDAEIEGLNAELDHVRSGRSDLQSRVNALESQQAASVGGEREAFEAEPYPVPCGYACVSLNKKGDLHIVVDSTERLANARSQHWREQGYVSAVKPVTVPSDALARAALSPAGGGVVMPTNDELQALSQECEKMKGGIGLHYLNYAREVLRRWGSKPQANSPEGE